MNIFVLDLDPVKASQYHVDRHVVKMVLESAQLLCTTHHILGTEGIPYKKTHSNHPCAIWTRESLENYLWLRELGLELSKEYSYRYGKRHKSQQVIESLPIPSLPSRGLTSFVLAMPEEFKIPNNAVASYRSYYRKAKSNIASWKKRKKPDWWN